MRVARSPAALATAAVAVVACAPSAHAGPRFDYEQEFDTPVPGATAGQETRILYKHPADPNAKPIPVRREVFTFPEGTVFDGYAAPVCTASPQELQVRGKEACPPESRVGGGIDDTVMTGFPGAGETLLDVDAFNTGWGLMVLGAPRDTPFFRSVATITRRGNVNTVEIPRNPGGPPDGESALRRIRNVFPAFERGGRASVRTPSTCPPSGFWTFQAQLTFADGAVETNVDRMPCRRGGAGARGARVRPVGPARLRRAVFSVRLRCLTVEARCAGRASLSARRRRLGSRRFSLRPGTTRVVRIRLRRRAYRRLRALPDRRLRRVRLRLTLESAGRKASFRVRLIRRRRG